MYRNRPMYLLVLVAFLVNTACSSNRWVPVHSGEDDSPAPAEWESLVGKRVRLHLDNGRKVEMTIESFDPPLLSGTTIKMYGSEPVSSEIRINVQQIVQIDVADPDHTVTFVLVAVLVTFIAVGFIIAVIAIDTLLSPIGGE